MDNSSGSGSRNSQSLSRMMSFGISDVALERVLDHIEDPRDRDAVSLVSWRWYRIDCLTRKHVTISLCYSSTPDRLCQRFPGLKSLKLKGKPRAAMFNNIIPDDWGGYAAPWIARMAGGLVCLESIHLRRMILTDDDVATLVRSRGDILKSLKLDKCSGFSTDALVLISGSCRSIRTLFLEESIIAEKEGQWLRELALNNSVLETLNFFMTDLSVSWQDLELIAKNCRSLISLKTSECDISNLVGFFRAATTLEEFGGGSFDDQIGEITKYEKICFPPRLCRLGLSFMGTNEMPVIFPFAGALKKLDLQYAFLTTEDHCELIQRCPNLEILEVRNVIGDRGLEVVAQRCRRLRRLRVERGEDEQDLEDEQGTVSHRGLSAIAQGCPELEYLAVYVSDIMNAALESIGNYSKNLLDFRLVLLERQVRISELPLDNGVRALLQGCTKLRRFALYLRPGGLTDVGLGYIGQYSSNILWMLLGHVGETDAGLHQFSRGCPKLQKLELRGCSFSELGLARAVLQLASLRYLWVQGYNASPNGSDLLAMVRPFWNIEFIPPRREINAENGGQIEIAREDPAQVLAYYSLAGQRADRPDTVIPIYPA